MFLGACSKPSSDSAGAAPSASSSGTVAVVDAAASANAVVTWKGTYVATAASLFVPDGGEWAGTKWHGDDAGDGLGNGTITLRVSGTHVEGSIDGALGPAIVDGALFGEHLSATIARRDPTDRGFVGVLGGTVKDKAFDGDMHLSSLVNANLLRQAKLDLTRGN